MAARADPIGHVVASLQRGYRLSPYGLITTAASPLQYAVLLLTEMAAPAHRHLPRLDRPSYQGLRFVHWSMAVAGRQIGWLQPTFHRNFRALLFSSALRQGVAVPVYCLMPDHLHVLVAGIHPAADQLLWAKAFRRALNLRLAPYSLQKQAYDHLLRPDESRPDAFVALIHYICENPVRAGLAEHPDAWAYTGACVAELPDLDPRRPDFSDRWWKLWHASGL